ncbi:MAG: DNA mismatch repair endonuclease MutL, partial [Pseudomonadota bacterium]
QVGCPVGTTFVIRDLFFNTPARYKFLKKDTTEATYVADMLSRIALARTDISFKLTGAFANRNEVFHTPGNNDLKSAVYNVFGRAFSMNTRDVNFEKDGIAITGIAGTPELARANRNAQIVFLNQRYIKSRLISSAADEAYKTFLMKNKFPFFVINIQMSPTLFDVNVHPSKLDVRFSNEGQLFSAIYHALNNAIQTHQEIRAPLETPPVQPIAIPEPIATPTIAPKALELELEVHPVTYEQETLAPTSPLVARETQTPQVISEHEELLESTYVGQLFNTYLVFQESERLFLIDQHAAHERIKYEEVRELFANSQLSSQPLLVPQIIHLSTPDLAVYHENESIFVTLGFEIEPFGGNSLAIRQVPSELEGTQIEEAFSALVNRFAHANQALNMVDDEVLYIIACKAAIKGNQRIDATAANQLLHALLSMKNPLSCPHGRPTILRVDRHDFEKLFKRIV